MRLAADEWDKGANKNIMTNTLKILNEQALHTNDHQYEFGLELLLSLKTDLNFI